MKIAIYFDNAYEHGGIETSTINLAESLNELGNEITFIFKTIGNIKFLSKMSKFANVIKLEYDKSYYDIVIYERHSDTPHIKGDKKGIIINTNILDWNDNSIVGEFDFYIAVSTECAQQFEKKHGIKPTIIPNIIKIKNENEPIEIKKGDINFVTVSRIDKRKGFEEMIDIVKLLEFNKINYYWYIVGSGVQAYENQIKELYKPYERVIFVGAKDNPYPYIKNSDTYVLRSETESQCIGMCEALKMGKRCIVGNFKTSYEYGANLIIKDNNYTIEDIIKKEKGVLNYPDIMELWKPILKQPEKIDYNFSIIIPNYNNGKWLEKCINSILNQTYKNYKIYFIDDMSTDNSVSIVKKILNKPHELFVNEYKKYNGGSRNVGIIEAKKDKSDYIVCLDSDDWFKDNNVLEDINKALHGEDILTLGFEMWNGKTVTYTQLSKYDNKFELFQANHGVCCAVWNKVVKTNIMPLFQWDTLMEDRCHHYKTVNNANTYKNLERVTHTWNRANTSSVTQSRSNKWNNCAYRHIADMSDLLDELNDEQYIKFIKDKIKKNVELISRGVYQQF